MRIKLLPLLSVLPVTYAAAIFLTIYLHTTRPFLYLTETLFYAYPQHIHLSALAYLFFLTYPIAGAVSAIAAAAEEGGYDSRQSIVSTTGLTGWALRAILAHQELLRTFPGAVMAILLGHYFLYYQQELLLSTSPLTLPVVAQARIVQLQAHLASLAALLFMCRLVVYISQIADADLFCNCASWVAHACPALIVAFSVFPGYNFWFGQLQEDVNTF